MPPITSLLISQFPSLIIGGVGQVPPPPAPDSPPSPVLPLAPVEPGAVPWACDPDQGAEDERPHLQFWKSCLHRREDPQRSGGIP